ncbi:MAG: ShlB/FhaC/HecB family hemolysin secretion/activation protein, partial [Rhodoferax sp.]|nr:ShlB/FhaC/HecB family hemolysin secretion/activation protein [Rhodoferax sp.]
MLCTLLLAAAVVHAQEATTFAIRGYQIEGNSLLPQAQISLAVLPFTGPKSSFETIQLALEALEKAYLKAGYGSIKIEVPEQDLQEGVVKLLVVEARLERITVEGQKFHDEANILRTLPALRSGQVVNVDALQRNLDLANESFAKHTSVTFR